jgi:hypothetical protein
MLSAVTQGLQAADTEPVTDLAATVRQGSSACRGDTPGQKKTTKDKVTCDSNELATGIIPAYQADAGGSYVAAVDALKTQGWINVSALGSGL